MFLVLQSECCRADHIDAVAAACSPASPSPVAPCRRGYAALAIAAPVVAGGRSLGPSSRNERLVSALFELAVVDFFLCAIDPNTPAFGAANTLVFGVPNALVFGAPNTLVFGAPNTP